MSKNSIENYTFFFKDGYYVTFPLTKKEFMATQTAFSNKVDVLLLDNYVILLADVRYVAKQEEKELPKSAVPEHLEQDVYEYLRGLERGKAEETGY